MFTRSTRVLTRHPLFSRHLYQYKLRSNKPKKNKVWIFIRFLTPALIVVECNRRSRHCWRAPPPGTLPGRLGRCRGSYTWRTAGSTSSSTRLPAWRRRRPDLPQHSRGGLELEFWCQMSLFSFSYVRCLVGGCMSVFCLNYWCWLITVITASIVDGLVIGSGNCSSYDDVYDGKTSIFVYTILVCKSSWQSFNLCLQNFCPLILMIIGQSLSTDFSFINLLMALFWGSIVWFDGM